MNTYIDAKERREMAAHAEALRPELERLAACGFTSEEMTSLLWLQKQYQTGGSDRSSLVRHWEFLKYLLLHGKLEAAL